jgi:hypothetical protein
LTGVERIGGQDERSDNCDINRISTLVSVSMKEVRTRAKGQFKVPALCSLRMECYVRSKGRSDYDQTAWVSGQTAHLGDSVADSSINGSATCSLEALQSRHIRQISVDVEIYPESSFLTDGIKPVAFESVSPMIIASTNTDDFGAGRNWRSAILTNEDEDHRIEFWKFVYAGLFGAAAAAVLDGLLSLALKQTA